MHINDISFASLLLVHVYPIIHYVF